MRRPSFFRADGSRILHHDTEDKAWWIEYGSTREQAFLAFCAQNGLLSGLLENPERRGGASLTLPEFIWHGDLLDLKEQRQPFFESQARFGIPPRYAVTLNEPDVRDIAEKYPRCRTVFWVNWEAVRYENGPKEIEVRPLHGVWLVEAVELPKLVDAARKKGRVHRYWRRIGDTQGNAQVSYALDLRELTLVWPHFPKASA